MEVRLRFSKLKYFYEYDFILFILSNLFTVIIIYYYFNLFITIIIYFT